MALNSMLRRASSSVAPLAMRAVGSRRSFGGAISTLLNSGERRFRGRSFPPSPLNLSTTAYPAPVELGSDENILRIVGYEIKYVEQSEDHDSLEIPDGFPFTIQDTPGERTVLLTRDYQGEFIRVLVDMPIPEMEGDKDGSEHHGYGSDNYEEQSSIPLVVSVSKGSGISLEFGITASPHKISIDNISIKNPESSEDHIAYEGPDFLDLNEDLQQAFQKYLEFRGIVPSATNFVLEYMINKDHKEYLKWLKQLRSFIKDVTLH